VGRELQALGPEKPVRQDRTSAPQGKGKRGPDLFEARRVPPLAPEPLGLQCARETKTPGIKIRGSCPGKKPCPGALIGREAIAREVPSARGLEQIGRESVRVTPKGSSFLIFHNHEAFYPVGSLLQ
jgi:hypothetical protein